MKYACQHCGCEKDLETLYRFCETKCPNCGLSMMSREFFSKILLEQRYPSRMDFFEQQLAKKYGEEAFVNEPTKESPSNEPLSNESSIDENDLKELEELIPNEENPEEGYITSLPVG